MEMAISVLIGLAAANFGWEAFTGKAWRVAAERTFFQALAIGVYLLATTIV